MAGLHMPQFVLLKHVEGHPHEDTSLQRMPPNSGLGSEFAHRAM